MLEKNRCGATIGYGKDYQGEQAKVAVELDCFALPVLFKNIYYRVITFSYGIKLETSGATGRARQVREIWSMYVGSP